ncbi:transcriptional regulator, AraC family [Methylobacterium sp. 4-46]|uniref:helix-turn-helix domain-containing protein n=1 Tax=unclassified Methylobacterium TaxID=2615210 RepID=UPI000165CE3E|nr:MULTISPECIES: helix-turn-helix domain-containing protein [Methylobacterium]ACA20488.1 transcriptional regulator, AraC family [Methylobacterium sp. 4-46]WFT79654.1 helix-turn-helix domain-containing protein [Methylobacterium nodulans]
MPSLPAQAPAVPHFFLYGEAPRDADDRFLHLEALDDRSRPNRWRIRPHVHAGLHQILHLPRGGGVMRAEAERIAFAGPCFLLVPAGTAHGFRFAHETVGTVLTLSDRYLRDLARREPDLAGLFRAPAALAETAPSGAGECLAELARELTWAAPGRRAALEGHLLVLLVAVLRHARAAQGPPAPPGPQAVLVARFREAVEARHREERPLDAYARDLGVTPARLRAACRAVTGESPGRIVRDRRLLEAKRTLLYSDLSVAEVAYSLGFSDPAYFSRFFAQGTGEPPRAFRARRGATG